MPLSEKQILNMQTRRQIILDSATYLFATEGYEGTTIKKVAEAAKVSFGSVFTYFKDKEELFYTVVVEPLEELSNQVLAFNPDAKDLLNELENMIKTHIRLYAGINNYLGLVVQVVGQYQRFPRVFEKLDVFHDEFKAKVILLIKNGQKNNLFIQQDPYIVATLYTSLLIGIRLNTTDNESSIMWDRFIPSTIHLFGVNSK
ncbi:TetR/AcrR family transcriptional regulator [Psychrobacillus sp. AK 1817]|uniref:TetR/AcrR family transcriptional regulator n=1 Tax=Psychrobacillus sp. AK 1817 TaxID=2303505 RepID=UPI0012484052|nr:TetR/AcrR family transcriptional regulator [Psychrobacillus sp. AK 1817]QEY20021.1 TetR/AcrR family transcriptional regulator [Psychrobacillus sp. AK 1817]QGM30553.1 TetR family transcriptional regulator [Bacillus sp. N3536]